MGCCFSRPEGPNSPYPGGTSTGSARAINVPPHPSTAGGGPSSGNVTLPSSPTSPSLRQAHRQRNRHSNQPLAQHINKPLRRHEWVSRSRTWTVAELARERAEFFDTRVTGREEIWQTIKAALEVLWHAESAARAGQSSIPQADVESGGLEEDSVVALATAQTILSAADITLPTGDLANGVYDALGNYYPLPEHVVSDPINVSLGPGEDSKADLTAGEETANEGELDHDDDIARRREEKGKGVVDVQDQVLVVVRLSETARDIKLHVGKEENVRGIIRRIFAEIGHRENQRIRIAYMGKILKENIALAAQGWKEGQVINAFMYEHR